VWIISIGSIDSIGSIGSIGGAKVGRFALFRAHLHLKRLGVLPRHCSRFLPLEGEPNIKVVLAGRNPMPDPAQTIHHRIPS
jgi:hypothetical protein